MAKTYRVRTAPLIPAAIGKGRWIWLRTWRDDRSNRQNPITKFASREEAQTAADKAQADADRTWGPGRYSYQIV